MRNTTELVDDGNDEPPALDDSWTVEVEGSASRFPLLAKFGVALGMLALLFVTALALGPMLLPPSVSAPYAERLISRFAGVDVSIRGSHAFRILPALRLQADNVVAADDSGPIQLTLPFVEIGASALGALSGSVDLSRFLLRDPALNIQTGNASGGPSASAPEIDRAWGWWRDMSLEELKIENANVTLSDGVGGRTLKFERFNVMNAAPAAGQIDGGLVLNGGGVLNGQDVTIAVTTSDPQLLVSGNRWPIELSFVSALLDGTFSGSIAIRERMVGEGEIKFSGNDVAALNKWIGPLLPARDSGQLSLAADIELAGDKLDVRRMELTYGATKLNGSATIDAIKSGAPLINASFVAETLDLGEAPAGDAMIVAEAPLMIPGMPSGQIDVSWQHALWRGFRFGAGKLLIERQPATQRLQMTLQDTAVYGGTMRGSFTFDASEGMRALSVEARAIGVDIAPMLAVAGDAYGPALSGKSTIALSLFSVGGTSSELIEALTGQAEVVASDGELMIAELVNGLVPEAGNGLPFKSLNASFKITQGIAACDDLLLRSGDMSLVGNGRIDLTNRVIDLNIGRLGNDGNDRSLKRYRVSGPATEMRVEPVNGS